MCMGVNDLGQAFGAACRVMLYPSTMAHSSVVFCFKIDRPSPALSLLLYFD